MFVCICRMNEMKRETEVETDRKEKGIPNKLRLRRGGGGGVGGCGVFAPRREISTSTRETVSPGARKVAGGGREEERNKDADSRVRKGLCICDWVLFGLCRRVPLKLHQAGCLWKITPG